MIKSKKKYMEQEYNPNKGTHSKEPLYYMPFRSGTGGAMSCLLAPYHHPVYFVLPLTGNSAKNFRHYYYDCAFDLDKMLLSITYKKFKDFQDVSMCVDILEDEIKEEYTYIFMVPGIFKYDLELAVAGKWDEVSEAYKDYLLKKSGLNIGTKIELATGESFLAKTNEIRLLNNEESIKKELCKALEIDPDDVPGAISFLPPLRTEVINYDLEKTIETVWKTPTNQPKIN